MKILKKIILNIKKDIKNKGVIFTIKDLYYRIISIRYKLYFKKFGRYSNIFGNISIFNLGEIFIGEKTRIDSYFRKGHIGCFKGGKIIIGNNVYINNGIIIDAGVNTVNIKNNCKIGPNVTIIAVDNHGKEYGLKEKSNLDVKIGKNVWIGANSIILPGIKIGDNTIIGAGSIVTKSQPENSICAGNPCKLIKKI